ncbi:DUF1405 domain-containing protein [Paenibacillus eucommiae]|uniref:Membrane protein YpjA n=1 Tax=Paenibacillus eucommiae TaxID=1355755 RepID=A0ABS4J7K0_9BACL|nr:putative membrane protein YpjA [Paenibacillus eucommiae]
MRQGLVLSMLWSKSFLTSSVVLWTLFLVNLAGTIYGYQWYSEQLWYTWDNKPGWYIWFVPDSPTASLFFTLSLLYLLLDRRSSHPLDKKPSVLRGFVEAFSLITSFKYGIWAVAMIAAGAAQGNPTNWQDGMLTVSHLGMAAEALLFARFYTYRMLPIVLVAGWTLWNDFMDYQNGIFPWLPEVLEDDLGAVEMFTISLSVVSIIIAILYLLSRRSAKQKTIH